MTRNHPTRLAMRQGMVRYLDPLAGVGAAPALEQAAQQMTVIAATTAPVRRYSWDMGVYDEVLAITPEAVDLSRILAGACPFLADHGRWSVFHDHMGICEAARIVPDPNNPAASVLEIDVRFDGGPLAQDLARRFLVDRTLRTVSIGYDVLEAQVTGVDADGVPTVLITRWQATELSGVPIPADFGAVQVRGAALTAYPLGAPSGENLMNSRSALMAGAAAVRTPQPPAATAGTQPGQSLATGTPGAVRAALEQHRSQAAGQTRTEAQPAAISPAQTRNDPPAADGTAAPAADAPAAPAAPTTATVDNATVSAADDGSISVQMAMTLRSQAVALGIPAAEVEQRLAAPGIRQADFNGWAMARAAQQQAARQAGTVPAGGAARVITDERDTFRRRALDGLMLRARGTRPGTTRADRMSADAVAAAREFRGISYERLAMECLQRSNLRVPNTRSETIRSALATTDFPLLLQSGLQRSLREAYEDFPVTFTAWANRVSLPDFRAKNTVEIGSLGSMREVAEGGEPGRRSMSEQQTSYKLRKFEEIVSVTFEALVNDDLDAFSRVPDQLALAARTTERRTVYDLFRDNGPTMGDNQPFFHASHGNIITPVGVPTVAALGLHRRAFRLFKDIDGQPINLQPSFILLPTLHETVVDQLFTGLQSGLALARADVLPGSLSSIIPIVDPYLDEIDADDWYMLAPQAFGAFEYAYLEGEDGLITEELPPGPISQVSTKARLVFAAAANNWRGATRQAGS